VKTRKKEDHNRKEAARDKGQIQEPSKSEIETEDSNVIETECGIYNEAGTEMQKGQEKHETVREGKQKRKGN